MYLPATKPSRGSEAGAKLGGLSGGAAATACWRMDAPIDSRHEPTAVHTRLCIEKLRNWVSHSSEQRGNTQQVKENKEKEITFFKRAVIVAADSPNIFFVNSSIHPMCTGAAARPTNLVDGRRRVRVATHSS